MKYLYSLLLLTAFHAPAQDLLTSRQSSYYTFIYRLSNDEARNLYESVQAIRTDMLHTPVDMYPTDSLYSRNLPVGHYVHVRSIKEKLHYSLESIDNIELNVLNNHRDLLFTVHDTLGHLVKEATIRVQNKRIRYDERTGTYRIAKANQKGLVEISFDGHTTYTEISRWVNNRFFARTGRKVLHFWPIWHFITSPIKYVVDNARSLIKWGNVSPPGIYYKARRVFVDDGYNYGGYMVFSKPRFKPGDTLHLKAFATNRKGRPLKRSVDVMLESEYGYGTDRVSKKMGTIDPYRKGAYAFTFHLSDTLKLKLDKSYSVRLRDRRFNTLQSETFRYEAYELNSNTYSIRSERNEPHEEPIVYLKGVDTNDQPLFDVQVELTVRTTGVKNFYGMVCFVPDTLWTHHVKLEPIGETRINLPDSIFPDALIDYEITASFLNAENEKQQRVLNRTHDSRAYPVLSEIKNDSMVFTATYTERSLTDVIITARSREGFVQAVGRSLPFSHKVVPTTDYYQIVADGQIRTARVGQWGSDLGFSAARNADSIFISTNNPRKIRFQYFLFRNQRLVLKGSGEDLTIRRKSGMHEQYSLSVQYVWGGESKSEEYNLSFNTRELKVNLNHPGLVYPGQEVEMQVEVEDAFGRPSRNTDVTVYASTRKFRNEHEPDLPQWLKKQKSRNQFNVFREQELEDTAERLMEYAYWNRTLGLDSIEFYHFLYPDSGVYVTHLPVKDSITQVSVFVVDSGRVQQPVAIYLDGTPVYLSSSDVKTYAFATREGKASIEVRLADGLITLPRFPIAKGVKTVISIDRNRLPGSATFESRSYSLTDEEMKKLSRYYVFVEHESDRNDFVRQSSKYFLAGTSGVRSGRVLLGPFVPGTLEYTSFESFSLTTDFEPFYSYDFKPGVVRMRQVDKTHTFPRYYAPTVMTPLMLRDTVLTYHALTTYYKSLEPKWVKRLRFSDNYYPSSTTGRLSATGTVRRNEQVVAVYVLNLDTPDQFYLFGDLTNSRRLPDATYQVAVLYHSLRYLRSDTIRVSEYGVTNYDLRNLSICEADSFSHRLDRTMRKWGSEEVYVEQHRAYEAQQLRESVYQSYADHHQYDHMVTGYVWDEEGLAVPGANVFVKGTTIGTVTNGEGYYELSCPDNSVLVISFIGYQTQEVELGGRSSMDFALNADVQHLSEVVVVGYGVQSKRMMTGSVVTVSNALQGRVAGVSMGAGGTPGDTLRVQIRGISSIGSNAEPLVIVDGVVSRLSDIDMDRVTAFEVVKDPAVTALYGSRASAGLIIVSTKAGMKKSGLRNTIPSQLIVVPQESLPGSTLRRNFSDYAIWQPKLRTDREGRASFRVTFPDDITGWNAYALAVGARKRSGATSSFIQSYKPLMAQVAVPHFLIRGDSATAIGKITNYSIDTLTVTQETSVDDVKQQPREIRLTNSRIDTILLVAVAGDSIKTKYTVSYGGYQDGEERTLPIYRVGTLESSGVFMSLPDDTTFTLGSDTLVHPLILSVQADLIDVVMEEIRYLKGYAYLCNEQLASKLQALLIEKQLMEFKGEKFTYQKEGEKIIKKLIGNQNENGSWDWWNRGDSGAWWVTLHVARTLEKAAKLGFPVAYDKEGVINYIEAHRVNHSRYTLEGITFLLEAGEKLNVREWVDPILRARYATVHDRLVAQRLVQLAGGQADLKWMDSVRRETIKGNYYWGEEREHLFDNNTNNTLLAYKILEASDANHPHLAKLRGYFLERRRRHWRNTYESGRIIETLLPALLREGKKYARPTLQLSGDVERRVTTFPYQTRLPVGSKVTVTKEGSSPVYLSAFYEWWNEKPAPVAKDYVISTRFSHEGPLKAGETVHLMVDLTVKKDAEYVMIEVPIPAGCSYGNKSSSRANGEVHREYEYHKTNIYCEVLRPGNYRYTIELVPRFTGSYTLNPAVAESMYFPTQFGRNEIDRVTILSND